jgi:hypothetical protein
MDHAIAFEGPIWTPELKVTGDTTINGNLTITGELDSSSPAFAKFIDAASLAVKDKLDQTLFTGYSDIIFKTIQSEGINLDKITQGGKEVVTGNKLGYHIVDTNIQRLGMVKDFQTQGENYLSETLYVTNGRVGINTMEPSAALSIWDAEVEINFNKCGQDTASIGTPRFQKLVLSSNGKQNLVLHTDGSVAVDSISINKISMTSAPTIPNYQGVKGQIVWNENPAPSSAVGWICLGGHFWAKFGTVE